MDGFQSPGGLNPSRRGAIIYRTHFWNEAIEAEVLKLHEAVADRYDVWVIGYVMSGQDFIVPAPIRKITYTERHLRVLGLTPRCRCQPEAIPARNLDFALLHFFRLMSDYDHYWLIEYDVRYSGSWNDFFGELDDPAIDFLGTVVQRREENPGWAHWPSLCTGESGIGHDGQVKAFTPVIRLSQRAFAAVDLAYRRGWHGHYEALWPTAVKAAGLRIEDIGALGSFTPAHRRGKHYTSTPDHGHLWPGSFVFRPAILESEVRRESAMLWHPVKPEHTPAWIAGAAPLTG